MTHSRRRFLKTSFAALAAASAGRLAFGQEAPASRPSAPRGLKILVLGGTGFLGPHVVERAVARGHTMTLFNRGKTHPGLFPDLEKLTGDRNGKLDALKGRVFDAVVDTSGYVPRHVKLSAELLRESGHYVFVSTCSVYPKMDEEDTDESTPVGTIEDETTEKVTNASYGPLKALCEKAAEAAMPGKVTALRPGLIVGPGDETDRFTYWPVRVAGGGEVLAPGSPDFTTQFVDVRDLAELIIGVIERKTFGTMNVVCPPVKMGDVLAACKKASKSDATFTWCDTEFLAAQRVAPWSDMPAWFPPPKGKDRVPALSQARAAKAGLTIRSLEETCAATLSWFNKLEPKRGLKSGIKASREKEVLSAWHAAKGK